MVNPKLSSQEHPATQGWYDNMWDGIQEHANRYAPDDPEAGFVKAYVVNRILAAVLVAGGVAYVAPPVAAGVVSRLGFGETVDVKNNSLSAEKIHAEAVHFDFRDVSVWAVEGEVGTRWTFLGKEIAGSGYGAKFQSSNTAGTGTDPRSKVLMWSGSGNLNSDPAGPKVTVEKRGNQQIVKFPIDALVLNTQFSEADTQVVQADRTFTQGLEGASKLGGFTTKLACNTVTLGKKQEMCTALFDFGSWANKNQAEVDQLLRYNTLEVVQKVCGPQQWSKESKLIEQSYKDEAMKEGINPALVGVEFVDKNGNVTTQAPDYTHSVLDGLKKKGILLKAPSGFGVTPVFNNIRCSEAKPTATPTTGQTGH